jgi:transposase-like protein
MIAITCPFCSSADVIRFGKNPCGTARLRCKACKKTWTPDKKSRAVSPETAAAIEGMLAERVSQRGIARAFHVSRDTIRNLRKKSAPP